MNNENLVHYEPTPEQWQKFKRINDMTEDEQDKKCIAFDDCRICDMAIHQQLLSCTKHICVQGMTERQFSVAMDNADCDF